MTCYESNINVPVLLRDLLQNYNECEIEVRTNYPNSWNNELTPSERYYGMLVGFCNYKNHELFSLDGDLYSLDLEVDKYEIDGDGNLVIWLYSDWLE